jgi:hypothetical protein
VLPAFYKRYTRQWDSPVRRSLGSLDCKSKLLTINMVRRIIGMQSIRRGWSERRRHPLQDLMRECRYRKATEPRDKIYSLLGLMGDHMNEYLQPDYSKSVGNVRSHHFQILRQANNDRFTRMSHVTFLLSRNLWTLSVAGRL